MEGQAQLPPLKERYERHNGALDDVVDDRDDLPSDDDDDGPDRFDDEPADHEMERCDDDDADSFVLGREEWVVRGDDTPGPLDGDSDASCGMTDGGSDAAPAVSSDDIADLWDQFAMDYSSTRRSEECNRPRCVAAPAVDGSAPRMPRGSHGFEPHRSKIDTSPLVGIAMVARPVGRAELARSAEAQASM